MTTSPHAMPGRNEQLHCNALIECVVCYVFIVLKDILGVLTDTILQPLLVECWPTVYDVGTTLNPHKVMPDLQEKAPPNI